MNNPKLHVSLPSFAILDASPYPQVAYDLDFNVWAVNRQHLAMTGARREEMVGRFLFDVFPPNPHDPGSDAHPAMTASLERMVATRAPDNMEIVKHDVRRPDGRFEERYWQMTHSPIWSEGDGEGEIIGALQTSRDVTAEVVRRKVDAAKQRAARVGTQLMFFELDLTTDYVECSDELQELYGYEPDAQGLPLRAFYGRTHKEDRDAVARAIDALRDAPSDTRTRVDYRMVRPDGETRWLSAFVEVVRDGESSRGLLTGVVLDATCLRRSEAELRQAVEERDLLIAEVHHRVKNSLQLVTSVLNMEAGAALGTDAADCLRRAADRVQAIAAVHGVLYHSTDVRSVDLRDFLSTLVEHVGASLGGDERGIRVEVAIPGAPAPLATDRAISLSLIVNELVTNAIKHAFPNEQGGTVAVTLELTEAGRIAVTISDDGIGRAGTAMSDDALDTGANTGMGSKLVMALSQQIGATLTYGDASGALRTGYIVRLELDA